MRFTFHAKGSGIPDVVVLRGEGVPKLDSGNAKWEVIDRPKRRGATVYQGSDPERMILPVLFDGWKARRDVELAINNLIRMTKEVSGEPPGVTIVGGIPRRGLTWVIEGIEWGDNAIWDNNGSGSLVRFRQDAVVHLLERVRPTVVALSSRAPGNTRGSSPLGAKHTRHTVKKGETLPSIAIAEYGDRDKWHAIARHNKLRGPRSIKVGQVLRLP